MPLITMASFLAPDRVIPALRAQTGIQVVHAMARVAAQAVPHDAGRIADAVLARAAPSAYAVGEGVALPHAPMAGLDRPIGVFARLKPACDFGAMDGRGVDLALLLLTPQGDDAMLLRALACGARRLRDPDVVSRIRAANGAVAMHAVLTSDAWRFVHDDPHAMQSGGSGVDRQALVLDGDVVRDDRSTAPNARSFSGGAGRSGNLVEGE